MLRLYVCEAFFFINLPPPSIFADEIIENVFLKGYKKSNYANCYLR